MHVRRLAGTVRHNLTALCGGEAATLFSRDRFDHILSRRWICHNSRGLNSDL